MYSDLNRNNYIGLEFDRIFYEDIRSSNIWIFGITGFSFCIYVFGKLVGRDFSSVKIFFI